MPRLFIIDIVVTLAVAAGFGWLLTTDFTEAFWASNVSLTWLLIPLWFGWRLRSPAKGAVWGLAMTWAGLAAYYLPVAGSSYAWDPVGMMFYVRQFGVKYFALGALSGPVMGAIGGWWRCRPNLAVPLLILVLAFSERWAWAWKIGYQPRSGAFTVEMILGGLLALWMAIWARRARLRPGRQLWSGGHDIR
ncbi:hypothetical protein AAEX63_03360 [Luteococcus sp. H138]|uniref:hypothetical protein n=1 Tax=unclassified Luteococcus TaxID=2639923 RepID=UPI00313F3111